MDTEKMSFEKAVLEVKKWLDHKKINDGERVRLAMYTTNLSRAVQFGEVALDHQTMYLKVKLQFPLTDKEDKTKVVLSELNMKPRLTVGDLNYSMSGVNPGNFEARAAAVASVLSDVDVALINKLDTEDFKNVQSIAVFFLPL